MNDRLELNHLRILASAGSGKTFQLTSRYLQLIAAGAALPAWGWIYNTNLGTIHAEGFDNVNNALSSEAGYTPADVVW